ncbi:activator-dependent family glycosyltransferase [Amycolatopsis suaedae]|uniref:Activator-dependent family glycosyltransferase n=1 Tax=Amycolatopsis suaedae TaxID=2510978 RepID=A0A4Q7J1A4_9PSEU|nr:activator-dependent family glycosyltransferase [Amycolatopsis suaedae]RZQ61170.1 activator-dependent family glycosyltransferase [Amycolatopsis suaedae]
MRVLFTTYPEKTIFQPMVPLAWALRTAGHDVRVASQPSFAAEITQAGLTAVGVGRHQANNWRRLQEIDPDVTDSRRAGLPPPYDSAVADETTLDPEAMRAAYRTMVDSGHKLNNFPLVPGLVEFARQWQPDLVVWEATTYAGALAARACGAAHARMLWSIDVFGVTRQRFLRATGGTGPDPLAGWLGGYARKYGFEFGEDLVTGQFTVDQLPGSLSMRADGPHYLPVRYVPYGGAATVPSWLRERPARPRIGLTLGTSAVEQYTGYSASVGEILHALSDLDVEVVATVAGSVQAKLGTVPGNARIVSYVPLHALAPTCSAVINHAGPGTLLTSALAGVPQLALPRDFDEPELARRAAAQGAVVSLHDGPVTGAHIREQVVRLLDEATFGERAAALREEILDLPAPGRLVGQLEELTVKFRTGVTR